MRRSVADKLKIYRRTGSPVVGADIDPICVCIGQAVAELAPTSIGLPSAYRSLYASRLSVTDVARLLCQPAHNQTSLTHALHVRRTRSPVPMGSCSALLLFVFRADASVRCCKDS